MERLYPLHYSAIDIETRQRFCNEFELKLKELHSAGFVFRDLFQTGRKDYQNFVLTRDGIRLIDTGISLLKSDIGSIRFDEFVKMEVKEIKFVKQTIVSHEIDLSSITKP
jgi:serine/threonine protein kinase